MSFLLYADKNKIYRKDWEAVTSGSVNVYAVCFQFSTDWDGLTKKAEGTSVEVPLDDGNGYIIPREVLTKHGIKLYAGVYGTRGGDTVLPTMWEFLGEVLEGAEPDTGNMVNPPFGSGAGIPGPQGEKGDTGGKVRPVRMANPANLPIKSRLKTACQICETGLYSAQAGSIVWMILSEKKTYVDCRRISGAHPWLF